MTSMRIQVAKNMQSKLTCSAHLMETLSVIQLTRKHAELTVWVYLQVVSSAIQLIKKTCRENSQTGCICRWRHQPSSSLKKMQTELTNWVHLPVALSAIQLVKKTCRQNSLPGCICRWPHQLSSS